MVRFLLPMNLEFIDQRPESIARTLTTMRGKRSMGSQRCQRVRVTGSSPPSVGILH